MLFRSEIIDFFSQEYQKQLLLVKEAEKAVKKEKEKTTELKTQNDLLEEMRKKYKKLAEEGENAIKQVFGVTAQKTKEEWQAFFEGAFRQLGKLETWTSGVVKGLETAGKSIFEGFNIPLLGIRIDGLQKALTDVIEAPSKAFKKYGFLDQYQKNIDNMRESFRGMGISEEQAFEATGELNEQLSDFSSKIGRAHV